MSKAVGPTVIMSALQVLSPSFHMSPDPSQPCAFVYSQAVCAAGTKISSSQAYAGMLASWRELAVRIAAPLLGYEILDKGPSLAYAFQSLEVGHAFSPRTCIVTLHYVGHSSIGMLYSSIGIE